MYLIKIEIHKSVQNVYSVIWTGFVGCVFGLVHCASFLPKAAVLLFPSSRIGPGYDSSHKGAPSCSLHMKIKVELISKMCGFVQKIITVGRVQINSFKHVASSSSSASKNVAFLMLWVLYSVHEMSHCVLFLTHSVSTFQHHCGVYSVLHFLYISSFELSYMAGVVFLLFWMWVKKHIKILFYFFNFYFIYLFFYFFRATWRVLKFLAVTVF